MSIWGCWGDVMSKQIILKTPCLNRHTFSRALKIADLNRPCFNKARWKGTPFFEPDLKRGHPNMEWICASLRSLSARHYVRSLTFTLTVVPIRTGFPTFGLIADEILEGVLRGSLRKSAMLAQASTDTKKAVRQEQLELKWHSIWPFMICPITKFRTLKEELLSGTHY